MRRFRKIVFCVLVALFLTSVPTLNAATLKAGSFCQKVGQTQISSGLLFTCIKSGKKTVWGKGVPISKPVAKPSISPKSTPSPTPSVSPSQNSDLDADGYPKNVPAPNRTCPNEGLTAQLNGIDLICKQGRWLLKSEIEKNASPTVSPSPSPNVSPSQSPTDSNCPPTSTPTRPNLNSLKVTTPLNANILDLNPSNTDLVFDSEVSITARKNFLSRLICKTNEKANIQWILDPKNDPKEVEQYQKEVEYAVNFFSDVVSPKIPLRVYIGSTENFQWIYDNLNRDLASEGLEGNWLDAKLARSKTDAGFHGGAGGLKAKDGTMVMFFNYGGRSSFYETLETQISFHEYTHVVQKNYLSGNMSPMLCWMREGYANYNGYNLTTRYSTAAYLNSWYQQYQYNDALPELTGWREKSSKDWERWFVDNEKKTPYQCDDYDNYVIGSAAWEYIMGTYGYAAIDRFFRGLANSYMGVCKEKLNTNNVICPGWKKLYLEVFGNKPESDYVKFGEHIYNKIKWIGTQKNLSGDAASILSPPAWTVTAKY